MESKVSIIIPVYNVENYLCDCLDSVIGQTYSLLEIILVDDGSKDSSGDICDEYAKRDNRIKVIHSENGGASAARNKGLEIATGEFLAFVDSDDMYENDAIEKMVVAQRATKTDIVVGKFSRIDDKGFSLPERKNDNFCISNISDEYDCEKIKVKDNVLFGGKLISEEQFWEQYVSFHHGACVLWNKLFKKELFENIRFPEGEMNEDDAVMWKLISKSSNILFIDTFVTKYRRLLSGVTLSKFKEGNLAIVKNFLDMMNYFRDKDISERVKFSVTNYVWGYGIGVIDCGYRELDLSDKRIKKKLDDFCYEYRKFVKFLVKGSNSISEKMKLILFAVSKELFFCIRRMKK